MFNYDNVSEKTSNKTAIDKLGQIQDYQGRLIKTLNRKKSQSIKDQSKKQGITPRNEKSKVRLIKKGINRSSISSS